MANHTGTFNHTRHCLIYPIKRRRFEAYWNTFWTSILAVFSKIYDALLGLGGVDAEGVSVGRRGGAYTSNLGIELPDTPLLVCCDSMFGLGGIYADPCALLLAKSGFAVNVRVGAGLV